jgi:NhaP-type Na+/H+ or K+/H+ antiporter
MTASVVATIAFLVVGWAVISGALARHDITGPLIFSVFGYVLANPDWGPIPIDVEAASVHLLAEATLALVLFSDASRVNLTELRKDVSLPLRLLGVGLPLTLVLGGLVAAFIFGEFTWALAGFVAAALAPTDAALSVQVINDERVPMRLRRGLNVESGLNDGIVTPIVTFTLAVAASQLGIVAESESFAAGAALRELGLGIVVGIAVGFAGAALISAASRRDWVAPGGRRLATLATAVGAFAVALAVDGNGFIAAFVAGIAFGATLDEDVVEVEQATQLSELGGELLALVVWFFFGATLVPIAFDYIDARVIGYALLSLTILRMLPVALAMSRSGLGRTDVIFLAWFGPRGLASVVFALLALEELGTDHEVVGQAVAVVALTVLLSVVLHGITAGPAGRRFVQTDSPEIGDSSRPRARPSGVKRGVASPGTAGDA